MEGWHTRLKKVIGKTHPNVFEIVEATEASLVQLAAGAAPPRRHRSIIQRDRMIAELN